MLGKVPLDVDDMKIDLMSMSSHKIYGPKGVGAVYIRRRPRVRVEPIFSGGGQERYEERERERERWGGVTRLPWSFPFLSPFNYACGFNFAFIAEVFEVVPYPISCALVSAKLAALQRRRWLETALGSTT
jgi:hypothetical protein